MDAMIMNGLMSYGWIAAVVLALVFYKSILWTLGVIIIDDSSIGIVTKKFVLFGSNRELPPNRIVALNGEAGYQADTLPPGLHWGYWPWQYDVRPTSFFEVPEGQIGIVQAVDGEALPDGRIIAKEVLCDNFQNARAFLDNGGQRGPQMALLSPGKWRINPLVFKTETRRMVVVSAGEIGIVEAKDGAPLDPGRVLAKSINCSSFQDAAAFFANGGQRGPQMNVITAGQYRINPFLFLVDKAEVTVVPENQLGVVTTKDGNPLRAGEIAGEPTENHNMFQDPMNFLNNGGKKGLQEEVLPSGTYFINPFFAHVEVRDLVEVPIAHAGVVVAFVGAAGQDTSGDGFKHGNIVSRGEKGVWNEVLDPGRYPINPYTHKVVNVPTANVVLNWANAKSESHKLDERLSTITVRSSDGFNFNLDVSQIIHIPRNDAPKVIARFGDMKALVTQVLEPMIGNYFRNAAQSSDVIDFLRNRSTRQIEARNEISNALKEYNVNAVETLIGDIVPPEDLMRTLTDRKLAEQEQLTYVTQQVAQESRQKLEQATALANTQASVVDAERGVSIAKYNAESRIESAKGEAESKRINVNADADVVRQMGDAEATSISAVGNAKADVTKNMIASMGDGNYASVQIFEAISKAGVKIVPEILVSGANGSNGSLTDVLMAKLVGNMSNNTPEAPVTKTDEDKDNAK